MSKYDHAPIEKKWQRYWKEKNVFHAERKPGMPKYYILDMFPYPSGAGLHVGHVVGYTGTDILARYKRQRGFNVLHPMGWDSFGLPAEQYAIRTGTHPAQTTRVNIDTYRKQLQALGFSYDWHREFATSDPNYYKWTQWIFTKLYEKGLAYEAEMNVNFCPALGTVLSNEEIENGKSIEGGYPVERRPLRQWVLRITSYAERLLSDLEMLDWPEHIKRLQANWIGKSEGVLLSFGRVSVFTTRIDTLFGVTYLVLAPEHALVDEITTEEQRAVVDEYRRETAAKSEFTRTEMQEEKTGVFTGGFIPHPVTRRRLPVWIADYVLAGYGTGAVMGVPAHDERDHVFATKYHLPIESVYDEEGRVVKSSYADLSLNGLEMEEAKERATRWLKEEGLGEPKVNYKLRDWLFSRQRYWGEPFPVLHFADGSKRMLDLDELPLCPPDVEDYRPLPTGESPLAKSKEWVEVTDPKTGRKAKRETNTMPQWAGSCWYYLRFADPHNTGEAWGKDAERYWLPVDLYVGGVEHAVLHLLYARFWHKVLYDCGFVHSVEPFLTLRNQGLVTARSFRKSGGGYVPPEEVDERDGKAFDRKSGEELQAQNEKMSKSKLNGVTPDEIIAEYGADSLRLYEMFMGPFDKEKIWSYDGVIGCRRFLNRFFEIAMSEKVTEADSEEGLKLGYRLLDQVSKRIETMQFNTAISHMMEFINAFAPLPSYPKRVVRMATQLLYPFAPHIAEEIWEHLGGEGTMTYEPLPEIEARYLVDEMATYVIQVNGKVRGRLSLAIGLSEADVKEKALAEPLVAKYVTGEVLKCVFVPNKLLSLVCGP